MELNIETKQQLGQLLAKPNSATQEHIPFLQQLIRTFPYYQPLHLLLAKASNESENRQTALTKAALYTNGSILHRIIHEPQELSAVENINIITYPPFTDSNKVEIVKKEAIVTAEQQVTNIIEAPEIENLDPLVNEVISEESPKIIETVQEDIIPVSTSTNDFVVPEIENLEPLQNEIIKVCEPQELIEVAPEADEQEVFEEINEFVAPTESFVKESQTHNQEEATETEQIVEENISENQAKEMEEELIPESVAAIDFFAFDSNFTSENAVEEETEADDVPEVKEAPVFNTDFAQENVVSKYDDDKLPYTFLWWLAKTRKDHEQIFRPFASPAKANSQPLQQQYVENIFHIQAPLEPLGEEQLSTAVVTKESSIIDNFIKNDPQIKALKPEQINNENKAKSSAEDSNDLVSETLAQIYIEQMLYHKAIDTYQKLSLKFPEKSGYFADLIQSLEKKI